MDTFDPKPLLQRDDCKPYPFKQPRVQFAETGKLLKSSWSFKQYGQSGLPVSDLSPNVAQCVDDLCILRSRARYQSRAWRRASETAYRQRYADAAKHGIVGPVWPGSENENLPGFSTICPTLAHGGVNNWGAAFLPAYCQGTPIGNASISSNKALVRHIRNDQISGAEQRRQLDFLARLNREHLEMSGADLALEGRINSFELAYRMQSTTPEAQDVRGYTEATNRCISVNTRPRAASARSNIIHGSAIYVV